MRHKKDLHPKDRRKKELAARNNQHNPRTFVHQLSATAALASHHSHHDDDRFSESDPASDADDNDEKNNSYHHHQQQHRHHRSKSINCDRSSTALALNAKKLFASIPDDILLFHIFSFLISKEDFAIWSFHMSFHDPNSSHHRSRRSEKNNNKLGHNHHHHHHQNHKGKHKGVASHSHHHRNHHNHHHHLGSTVYEVEQISELQKYLDDAEAKPYDDDDDANSNSSNSKKKHHHHHNRHRVLAESLHYQQQQSGNSYDPRSVLRLVCRHWNKLILSQRERLAFVIKHPYGRQTHFQFHSDNARRGDGSATATTTPSDGHQLITTTTPGCISLDDARALVERWSLGIDRIYFRHWRSLEEQEEEEETEENEKRKKENHNADCTDINNNNSSSSSKHDQNADAGGDGSGDDHASPPATSSSSSVAAAAAAYAVPTTFVSDALCGLSFVNWEKARFPFRKMDFSQCPALTQLTFDGCSEMYSRHASMGPHAPGDNSDSAVGNVDGILQQLAPQLTELRITKCKNIRNPTILFPTATDAATASATAPTCATMSAEATASSNPSAPPTPTPTSPPLGPPFSPLKLKKLVLHRVDNSWIEQNLPYLPDLTHLSLRFYSYGPVAPRIGLGSNPMLSELTIDGATLSDALIELTISDANLPHLSLLSLFNCDGIESPKIQHSKLRRCELLSCKDLVNPRFENCPQLEHLALCHSCIADDWFENRDNFPMCNKIRELDLSNCKALVELRICGLFASSLRVLNLSFCSSLTNVDLEECAVLRELHLTGCRRVRRIREQVQFPPASNICRVDSDGLAYGGGCSTTGGGNRDIYVVWAK